MGEDVVAVEVVERMIRQTRTRSRKAAGMVVWRVQWNVCGLGEVSFSLFGQIRWRLVKSPNRGSQVKRVGRADSRHLRAEDEDCRPRQRRHDKVSTGGSGRESKIPAWPGLSDWTDGPRLLAAILISSSPFRSSWVWMACSSQLL